MYFNIYSLLLERSQIFYISKVNRERDGRGSAKSSASWVHVAQFPTLPNATRNSWALLTVTAPPPSPCHPNRQKDAREVNSTGQVNCGVCQNSFLKITFNKVFFFVKYWSLSEEAVRNLRISVFCLLNPEVKFLIVDNVFKECCLPFVLLWLNYSKMYLLFFYFTLSNTLL